MNLHAIEEKISLLCPYVKEIVVTIHNGHPFALIYPNFQTLKSANIINIESENPQRKVQDLPILGWEY